MTVPKDLPDDKISVLLIKCGKCKNPVLIAGVHDMTRKDKNEAGRLVTAGCTSETLPLLEYRKLIFTDWCNSKCESKIITNPIK